MGFSFVFWGVGHAWLAPSHWAMRFSMSVVSQLQQMWLGLVVGILSVGLLTKVPREVITKLLGNGGTVNGILRAVLAGVVLDLCSHGILLVGMKLYQRGASLGQVMAFLIASPWNSLSLTLVLWALIGFKWLATFLLLSLVVGLVTGLIFDALVDRGTLPANPHQQSVQQDDLTWGTVLKEVWPNTRLQHLWEIPVAGLKDALPLIQWLFLGVILAAGLQLVFTPVQFQQWFGPSLLGLGVTLVGATVIEVCSEGSVPIAAEILNRAGAVGNSFAFLMAGVSTDYTELMVLRQTTGRWKPALFLPLVTLPQILVLAWILNHIKP